MKTTMETNQRNNQRDYELGLHAASKAAGIYNRIQGPIFPLEKTEHEMRADMHRRLREYVLIRDELWKDVEFTDDMIRDLRDRFGAHNDE